VAGFFITFLVPLSLYPRLGAFSSEGAERREKENDKEERRKIQGVD